MFIWFDCLIGLTVVMQIDQLDVRLRAVRAVGWLFSLRNGPLPDGFNRLHEEYMKRFQDDDVAIRLAVVEGAKKCLIADPFDEAIEFLREAFSMFISSFELHAAEILFM